MFGINISPPRTLVSERMVPCPRHHDDCFLLHSNDDTPNNESLHMGTINALLLSLKSAMVFQDGDDSSRHFLYAPRSLHTASLTEYNPRSRPKTSPSSASKSKRVSFETPPAVAVDDMEDAASPVAETEEESLPTMKAVSPSELMRLYHQCLDTGNPTPRDFCRQVAVSPKDFAILKDLLVTTIQLQQDDGAKSDNLRLLQVQVGMRLALVTHSKFLKLHHEIVYKSASNKKIRKKLKHMAPQKVLEEQVLNLLSLLAIRCDSPADFRVLVQQLCVGVPKDVVQCIYEYFELNDDDKIQQPVPAVTPIVAKTDSPLHSSPAQETTLPPPVKREEIPNKVSLLAKSISLTESRSTRKNPLVPNQKRKYVGSHFGTRLSNVSTLFRQVTVPAVPKAIKQQQIKLEPRPPKRPRTISFQRAKKVITETPAKRLEYTLSPIGGGRSDSQNARLVAQEALAAARRKR